MNKPLSNKKGFTLIEIVLVLAIAGLIMVVVFLAVTGAQKSQRDQARRDYVNRLAAAVVTQYGNNNSTWDCAANVAVLGNVNKPQLGASTANVSVAVPSTTNAQAVNASAGHQCTITMVLENGGNYAKTVTP